MIVTYETWDAVLGTWPNGMTAERPSIEDELLAAGI
jgi:hypothetical protein